MIRITQPIKAFFQSIKDKNAITKKYEQMIERLKYTKFDISKCRFIFIGYDNSFSELPKSFYTQDGQNANIFEFERMRLVCCFEIDKVVFSIGEFTENFPASFFFNPNESISWKKKSYLAEQMQNAIKMCFAKQIGKNRSNELRMSDYLLDKIESLGTGE